MQSVVHTRITTKSVRNSLASITIRLLREILHMSYDLDVVIDTPTNSVDMKTGLSTLQGASDAVVTIAEAILKNKIPKRITKESDVRTSLKHAFKGSYGQAFSINISDPQLVERFNDIGKITFSEIMSYFIKHSLYLDTGELSDQAAEILENLGDTADELENQLRVSALRNLHKASTAFGHEVQLRFRKTKHDRIVLAKFDQETIEALETRLTKGVVIEARITRLNIYTGNGRLVVNGENETVAFGFSAGYRYQTNAIKKKLSKNLDYNNGIDDDDCRYLTISAQPLKQRNGKIVKYLITSIE